MTKLSAPADAVSSGKNALQSLDEAERAARSDPWARWNSQGTDAEKAIDTAKKVNAIATITTSIMGMLQTKLPNASRYLTMATYCFDLHQHSAKSPGHSQRSLRLSA